MTTATETKKLAQDMGAVARTLEASDTLQDTLDAIVVTARDTVPGADDVSISIVHKNRLVETAAATGDRARRIDAIQYELGEGPCLDTLYRQRPVEVDNLHDPHRWPKFSAAIADIGVRSRMAFLLYTSVDNLGALNCYSDRADVFDREAEQIARLFATHAGIAFGQARTEQQLNQGLLSRKVIGQAIGIAMERFGVDEDHAFQYLVRSSRDSNTKLAVVAANLVDTHNRSTRQPE
ncbi:GAF and ANTAR domain-containing protein [soil metagenome]